MGICCLTTLSPQSLWHGPIAELDLTCTTGGGGALEAEAPGHLVFQSQGRGRGHGAATPKKFIRMGSTDLGPSIYQHEIKLSPVPQDHQAVQFQGWGLRCRVAKLCICVCGPCCPLPSFPREQPKVRKKKGAGGGTSAPLLDQPLFIP